DQAEAVALTDTLPGSVSFTSANPDQGSCAEQNGLVSCDLGNLAPLASATVTIHVTATQAGAITDSASVTSTTSDPNTNNNDASTQTTVEAPPPSADLALQASDALDPVLVRRDLLYFPTLLTSDLDQAEAVALTDTLPGS